MWCIGARRAAGDSWTAAKQQQPRPSSNVMMRVVRREEGGRAAWGQLDSSKATAAAAVAKQQRASGASRGGQPECALFSSKGCAPRPRCRRLVGRSKQSSLIGRHNTRKRQIAAHSEGARTLHCSASPGGPTDTAASRRTAPGSHTAIKREAVFTLTDREWACSQRTFSAFQRTLRFQFSPGACRGCAPGPRSWAASRPVPGGGFWGETSGL